MKSLFASIQFLTICPFPAGFQFGEKELRQSVVFFPIVGLLLGGALSISARGLGWLFPPLLASATTVILMLAVSGCFHMDGLADTADGFLSSRPKERILEIMRDSRTGPMGVIAVICVVVLKVAALVSVPKQLYWGTVFLMPLAGRCAIVLAIAALPYARPQGGLASAFGRPRWRSLTLSLLLLFAAGWLALRIIGLAAVGSAILITLLFSMQCNRKIGGFTGDTLGAACEIAELAPALVVASWRLPQ
jgi:adenosylcobinamide-GDP ribazoletransferase